MGRVERWKGVGDLVAAFRGLAGRDGVGLVLAGSGPGRAARGGHLDDGPVNDFMIPPSLDALSGFLNVAFVACHGFLTH